MPPRCAAQDPRGSPVGLDDDVEHGPEAESCADEVEYGDDADGYEWCVVFGGSVDKVKELLALGDDSPHRALIRCFEQGRAPAAQACLSASARVLPAAAASAARAQAWAADRAGT